VVILCGERANAHPGSGIVVDREGNIYFTDTGMGTWKIDVHGKLTKMPSSRFHWMALDERGAFSGSEKGFSGYFERVTERGSRPSILLCSDFPLTVGRDGNIYYADTRSRSSGIVRLTPAGADSVLARGKMFEGVTGIAAGPEGSLYVTDASGPGASVIRRIAPNGEVSVRARDFLPKNHGGVPPSDMDAGYCRGLAVDSAGNVYVAATGSRSVLKISTDGAVETVMRTSAPWTPTGVALFGDEVYVLEWHDVAPAQSEVREAWLPRVRKAGSDGTVTTLATVSR
jgi:sugar lactone lactonase YvrE